MKNTLIDILATSWPTIVIFLVIVSIMRISYLKHNSKKIIFHKELFFLVFIGYILLLFELVTYKEVGCIGYNFIPFKEIFRYEIGTQEFYTQVIGNIVLLVPFGFFVASYIKINKLTSIFFVTLLTSLIIETVQYFIGRCFDIDDIILNVVGGVIGFFLYVCSAAIKDRLPKVFQSDLFCSIISFLLILFIVLYLLGLKPWGLL